MEWWSGQEVEAGSYPGFMQLIVLGSNGTYPTAGRPASGYLVSDAKTRLWMDAGPGTYLALCNEMDPTEIDGVILSHRHPDHCSDFFALYHALAYGPSSREPVPVVCPPGLADDLSAFLHDPPTLGSVFRFVTSTGGDTVRLGTMNVSMALSNHPPPTLAPRITVNGRALTYTADTGPSAALIEHAKGSDLLLAEAGSGSGGSGRPYPFHMTGSEAGVMAVSAGVGRLVLTHIPAYVDPGQVLQEAESEFQGRVTLAVPGARIAI